MSAWIESHQTLRDHPRKDQLAELLFAGVIPDDVADFAAIGLLHSLWWWALDYAQDGDLSSFSDRQIARACRYTGAPQTLVEALVASGFVTSDRRIHDWHDYAGRLIERRQRDRDRKAASRSSAAPTEVQRTSDGQDEERRTLARAHTEPNPTEQNQEHASTADAADAPDDLFDQFWNAYPRKVGRAVALRRWRRMGKRDRLHALAAAGHLAQYVLDTGAELQYVPQGDTFLGPQEKWREWSDGAPDGYAAKDSGPAKRPCCPSCESDLTWDEDGEHCPCCDWRAA